MNKRTTKKPAGTEARITTSEIAEQRICDYIRELNSVSEERLNATALSDGVTDFTYRKMFRMWEKYAETFSALNITGENRSRAGLFSLTSFETIFCMYALNMTGASVSLLPIEMGIQAKKLRETIQQEGITDLIITDILVFPNVASEILRDKEKLGLNNIIFIRPKIDQPYTPPRVKALFRLSRMMTEHIPGVVYLNDLIRKYEASALIKDAETSPEAMIITHTSGTTSGIQKPIPFTNSAFNHGAAKFIQETKYRDMFEGESVSVLSAGLSACFSSIDQLHLPLSFGEKIYLAPILDIKLFFASIEKYGVNLAFLPGMALFGIPYEDIDADFSGVRLITMGGAYIAPDKKKKFDDYIKGSSKKTIVVQACRHLVGRSYRNFAGILAYFKKFLCNMAAKGRCEWAARGF